MEITEEEREHVAHVVGEHLGAGAARELRVERIVDVTRVRLEERAAEGRRPRRGLCFAGPRAVTALVGDAPLGPDHRAWVAAPLPRGLRRRVDALLRRWERTGGSGVAWADHDRDRVAVARLGDGRTRVLVAMGRGSVVACTRAPDGRRALPFAALAAGLFAAPALTHAALGPGSAAVCAVALGAAVAWRASRPTLVASP